MHCIPSLTTLLLLSGSSIAQNQNQAQNGIRGVRKMSSDKGEKFFPEYWAFHNKRSMGNVTDTTTTTTTHEGRIHPSNPPHHPIQNGEEDSPFSNETSNAHLTRAAATLSTVPVAAVGAGRAVSWSMQTPGQGAWAVIRRDRGVPGSLGGVARDIRLVWGSWGWMLYSGV